MKNWQLGGRGPKMGQSMMQQGGGGIRRIRMRKMMKQ
jgi:hypothetical protein